MTHDESAVACDHETHKMPLGSQAAEWCRRCGSLHIDGQWKIPSLRVPDSEAIRDRDTMHETLTIVQGRSTAQTEEIRLLKARLARYGG